LIASPDFVSELIAHYTSDINSIGYHSGMSVLAACADADLLPQIQERLNASKDRYEKAALEKVVSQIKTRLNK